MANHIIVRTDDDVQIFTNILQPLPPPAPTSGAVLAVVKLNASAALQGLTAYDLDLANASAPVLLMLPDATLIAGQPIEIKVISFSSSYYWQLLTTNGQTVDQYGSGQISSQNVPSDQALWSFLSVRANSIGKWNIIAGGVV